jgi:hypothetical protein
MRVFIALNSIRMSLMVDRLFSLSVLLRDEIAEVFSKLLHMFHSQPILVVLMFVLFGVRFEPGSHVCTSFRSRPVWAELPPIFPRRHNKVL